MTIVAYTYRADTYCPSCVIDEVRAAYSDNDFTELEWAVFDSETWLEGAAKILEIDQMDESSYDSGDFPKIVCASMIEKDEYCGECHGELL